MEKKKKFTKKTILLLMITIILPLSALVATAIAATTTTTNMTVVKDDSGNNMYTVETKNGVMNYQTKFVHSSTATLSYHTKYLYFTKDKLNGNAPTSATSYAIERSLLEVKTETIGSTQYETYRIPEYMVKEAIGKLYGQEYVTDQSKLANVTLYLSHGFIIKRRDSAQDDWNFYENTVYNTLSGIQSNAKDPYNGSVVSWSSGTYRNFQFYFDCPLKINVARYNITVEAGTGGSVGQSSYSAYLNETVTVNAFPDRGYSFAGWEIVSGSIGSFNKTAETSSFTMPANDVMLRAIFKEKITAPTPVPKPSSAVGTPIPTVPPTATPAPTPTPEPYFPTDNVDIYKENYRYYTTDAGYTMEQIYNKDVKLASASNDSDKTSTKLRHTQLTKAYSVGTDSSGNTWFFIPSGTNATYVHPNIYNKYNANTAEAKHITELTFPSSITYNGTAYTVTSIGGGASKYNGNTELVVPDGPPYIDNTIRYNFGSYVSFENGTVTEGGVSRDYEYETYYEYSYGVLGNGSLISYDIRNQTWTNTSTAKHDYQSFAEEYHVYNTTLRKVTIPSTVTTVCEYAFANCQALVLVEGGENVTNIGEYGFSAGDQRHYKLSERKSETKYRNYYYNEDSGFSAATSRMQHWQDVVRLPEYCSFGKFSKLKTIAARAFTLRNNLGSVVLSSTVTSIGENAFAGCELDSIEIPGKTTTIADGTGFTGIDDAKCSYGKAATLGTKGTKDTVIVTIPGANALNYGLVHDAYYTIQAGYKVTYHKNMTPTEDNRSFTTEIEQEFATVKEKTEIRFGSNNYIYITEEGGLFTKSNDSAVATRIAPNTTFASLVKIPIEFQSGSTVIDADACFAIGTNGEVWGTYEAVYNGTWYGNTWTNLNMPAGASSIQLSSSKKAVMVYYLNTNQKICVKKVVVDTSVSGKPLKVTHSQILDADSTFKYLEFTIAYKNKENLDTTFPAITTAQGYNCTFDNGSFTLCMYGPGQTYSAGLPPVIYATAAGGAMYHFPVLPFLNETSPVCYRTPESIGARGSGLEIISGLRGAFRKNYLYYTLSDSLYQYDDTSTSNNKHALVGNGNFEFIHPDSSEREGLQYVVLKNKTTGQGYVLLPNFTQYTSSPKLTSLPFNNPETAELWEHSYRSSSDGATVRYLYGFPADGTNTLYCVSSNGYVSTTTGVKKVVRASNSSSGITKALMLKTDGTLRGMGTSSYGELGLNSGEYTSFTTSAVSGSVPVFTDICFVGSYSCFALTNAGVVYGAGFNNNAWGNTDNHYKFEKIPNQSFNPFMEAPEGPEIIRTAFKYKHTFYDSDVFSFVTSKLLDWNTLANGTGVTHTPGTTAYLTASLDVYGQWASTEGHNTVRYIPNGGVGVMEDDVYPASIRAITLKTNAYERRGYEFAGWSYAKEPGPSDKIYPDMSQITIAYGMNELYAQWKPLTYKVKVGSDDMRVTNQSFSTHTLQLDQTLTLGKKSAKTLTVNFNPNKQSSMSTTPSPNTVSSKTASLDFYGWLLYEDTNGDGMISASDDKYLNTYGPNTTVKNLTTKKDVVLYAFPYWSGKSSSVALPEYTCTGYELVGFTPGNAYAPDYFASDALYDDAVVNNTLIVAPVGSSATYQPKIDGETLYAYYEAKTYKIELVAKHSHAEEGEITENQTSVYMIYDQEIPSVMIPQSERFVFMGYYDTLDSDGVPVEGVSEQFYDERGNAFYDKATESPKIWRIDDGSVTTLYAFFTSETKVTLDGRGATKQEQAEVIMSYEALGPDVIPPEKTGYTFQGYFTGIRGTGKQYFDASGKCITVWTEKKVNRLYAYWVQNPAEYPEIEDTENPAVLPAESVEIVIAQDKSTVHIYADDNNPHTDAETDVPPYQVEDIVRNSVLENAGGIPSTEKAAIRAKMGSWFLSCKLERRSGVDYVRIHVTVPYRTQYEDAEDEHLIISETRYFVTEVMVPKAWSYWELTEGGLYTPERVVINNSALESGQVEIPVRWECADAVKKVQYYIETYGEKENHVKWNSYDTDESLSLEIVLPTEEYIVSEIPGKEPDVTEYLRIVSYNTAWNDNSQFIVKNDCIFVEGFTLLSNAENENGAGENPDIGGVAKIKKEITETAYNQTYMSGVSLLKTAENGRYETDAKFIYGAVPENVGERKELHINGTDVNEINIHTPVVCIPVLQAIHDEMYQCEKIPENHTVLVSDCEGVHSDFILKVTNAGWHSEKKGYGERDYGKFLAEKDGRKRNEVKFPFPVWIDIGNDKGNSNDHCLEAGEWYVIGEDMQRFYIPVWIEEGSYEILVRSVAVNGSGREEKAEKRRNEQLSNYVAAECIKVYVTGRLYGFTVYEVNGSTAWEDVPKGEINYMVGIQAPDYDVWDTLPLRVGGHPYYRNIGGFPAGGSMKFYVKSNGGSFGKDTTLTVVPYLFSLEGDEYRKVDIYYEEESEKGVFLKAWDAKERSLVVTSEMSRKGGQEYMERLMNTAEGKRIVDRYGEQIEIAASEWYGEFSLPERLYVAKAGTDVVGIQKREGLSFTEEFWLDNVPVVLKFALLLENSEGDVLYYGMIPEQITNNIWKMEAKDSYREDKKGNRYEIHGGEVAVIYPGDGSEIGKTSYGIY